VRVLPPGRFIPIRSRPFAVNCIVHAQAELHGGFGPRREHLEKHATKPTELGAKLRSSSGIELRSESVGAREFLLGDVGAAFDAVLLED
jgi:hypothetical protein